VAGNNARAVMIDLKIESDKMYTRQEIADILHCSFYTIKNWSDFGLKSKRNGIQVLAVFKIGQTPYIIGKNLVEFLNKTQK
jgi:hypothetical protein